MNRCKWCNLKNQKYIYYHDNIWGKLNTSDEYLYKMLILESFQAGLSWECILNKIDNFEVAFDNFNIDKIINNDENKVNEGKMIDGVCAGIAEYFDADPTVIRLLWILFCAMGGSGILAYIICMIVFPRKDIEYIKKR